MAIDLDPRVRVCEYRRTKIKIEFKNRNSGTSERAKKPLFFHFLLFVVILDSLEKKREKCRIRCVYECVCES